MDVKKEDLKLSNTTIIGIDHGYKNMKGANCMFATRLSRLESKPDQMDGVIEYDGNYYSIYGESVAAVNHHIKSDSIEFYILTLAVIGEEFEKRGISCGPNKIHLCIGCGLPQRWFDAQKESFSKMLKKNSEVKFSYNGRPYNIVIDRVDVFMQGFAALPVITEIKDKTDRVILVDIGGETVDMIVAENYHLLINECKIALEATITLLKNINSELEGTLGVGIPESDIIKYLSTKDKNSEPVNEYEAIMKKCLIEYADIIFTKLKQWKVNTEYSQICFLGGGARIIKAFGTYKDNIHFCEDMKINAKGYEAFEKRLCAS